MSCPHIAVHSQTMLIIDSKTDSAESLMLIGLKIVSNISHSQSAAHKMFQNVNKMLIKINEKR